MSDKALELLNSLDGRLIDEEDSFDYLVIDSNLRTISIPDSFGVIGVYSDDSVKRVRFKMPRYFNEIDLSEFKINVNYIHSSDTENGDRYIVTDYNYDDENIVFTWVVGRRAFLGKGTLLFNVCLRKYDSEDSSVVIKEFNTTVSKVKVLEGLETDPAVVTDYSDAVNQLINDWESRFSSAEDQATNAAKVANDAADRANEMSNDASENALKALEASNLANNSANAASEAATKADRASENANAATSQATNAAKVANDAADLNDKAVQELTQRVQNGEFNGKPFTFDYIVENSEDLDNITGMSKGDFAIISTDVNLPENAQMFMYDGESWQYVADFSGSIGISVSSLVQTTESVDDEGVNVWTATLSNGDIFTFNVRNGSKGTKGDQGPKPERGVDYWTEEDQKPIDEAIQNATYAASLATISSDKADKSSSKADAAAQRAENAVNSISKRYGNVLKRTTDESPLHHIEDAYPSDLWEAVIYGKSEQQTTTGKNLFNPELLVNSTYYSQNDDGSFNVIKTNNEAWTSVLETITFEPGTYTIHGSINFEMRDVNDLTSSFLYINNDNSATFTISETTSFKFKINFALNSYPYIVKLQIEEGTEATEWEPYTGEKPSPSVDYPQEIVSANSIDVTSCGKNLFKFEDDLQFSGIGYANSYSKNNFPFVTEFVNLLSNFIGKEISYSCDFLGTQMSGSQEIGTICFNKNNRETILAVSPGKSCFIPNEIVDTDYIVLYGSNGDYETTIKNYQFEFSSSPTKYSPYIGFRYSIPIYSTSNLGDNLLPKDYIYTLGCFSGEYGMTKYIESSLATTTTFHWLYGHGNKPIGTILSPGAYKFDFTQTGGNFEVVNPYIRVKIDGNDVDVPNGGTFSSENEMTVVLISNSEDLIFTKDGDYISWEASVRKCESYEMCSLPDGTRDELRIDELGNVTLVKNTYKFKKDKFVSFTENNGDPYLFLMQGVEEGVNPSSIPTPSIPQNSILCNKYFYNTGNPRIYRTWNQVIVFDNRFSSLDEANSAIEDTGIEVVTYRYTPKEISIGTIDTIFVPDTISNLWIDSNIETTGQITYEQDLSIAIGAISLAASIFSAQTY